MEYDVNDTSLGLEKEHAALAWLRANDPIHWDAKNEAWLLTRSTDIREVLSPAGLWSSAGAYFPPRHMDGMKNSLVTMDDPEHARHRAILARAFTPRMLERQASRARVLMDDAIDAIADQIECEFVQALATPLPMRRIAEMVGFESDQADEFRRLSDALFKFSTGGPENSAAREEGVEAIGTFVEHVRRGISERRARPRDDLLSVLVESMESEELRAEDVVEYAVLLVSAGNETTRHTISWGVHALLEKPEEMARLRAAPDRLVPAVEECLRWASVVRGLKRTAVTDTQLSGQKVRRGDAALLVFPSANRDEEVFDQPFEFRGNREPNRHLAFGQGVHHCLGANLARMELRIGLAQILRRLDGLRLSPSSPFVPRSTALTNGVEAMGVCYDAVRPRERFEAD